VAFFKVLVLRGVNATTSRSNAQALFKVSFGAAWGQRFAAVVCGEDV
jgi:hypothetical protein